MELGAIFLLLALFLGVGLYLAAPLVSDRMRGAPQQMQELSSLMAERDRVINALQELDFDHKLGKIPEDDYPGERAELLEKGTQILKKLDQLTSAASNLENGNAAEDQLEKAVAARRADASNNVEPLSDDEIESMLAARRKERKSKSAGFCPRCGKPILISDRFCPSCGKAIK